MPQNLFSRLIKYRPTETVTPKENFLTEAFAAILENDRTVAIQILKEAQKSLHIDRLLNYDHINIKIATQVRLPSKRRPDLVISYKSGDDFEQQIFFEIKWESREGYNQIPDYQKEVSNLIYLTKPGISTPRGLKSAQHWNWNKIAKIIATSTAIKNTQQPNQGWITTEFLSWLEEEGMALMDFNLNDFHALQNFGTLLEKLKNCFVEFEKEKLKTLPINDQLDWRPAANGLRYDLKRWQLVGYIDRQSELCLVIGIGNNDFPYTSVWIESNPSKSRRNDLLKKAMEYLSEPPRLSENFKVSEPPNNPWELIGATKPLISLVDQNSELSFEKLHKWWIERIQELADCGIIEALRST